MRHESCLRTTDENCVAMPMKFETVVSGLVGSMVRHKSCTCAVLCPQGMAKPLRGRRVVSVRTIRNDESRGLVACG